jgi:hypothetical protein
MQVATARPDSARRPTFLETGAGVLLAASVVLHVVAMLPKYFVEGTDHQSLFSQPDQAALYLLLAAAWALALGIGLTGPTRIPLCAGLAVGLAATEFGFRISDIGSVVRYGSSTAGAGIWLMTAAWAVGAAGAVAAIAATRRNRSNRGSAANRASVGWTLLVGLLALVVAGAFLPPWDHYTGVSGATGRAVSFNLGNAFSGPWEIIVGNLLVAAALLSVPLGASRRHDRGVAAAAITGALLVLACEFVSAVVQVDHASPAVAGLTPAQASQLRFVINLKLTGWFTVDVLAAFSLFVAVTVWATARTAQENSPDARPSAPEFRNRAISSAS